MNITTLITIVLGSYIIGIISSIGWRFLFSGIIERIRLSNNKNTNKDTNIQNNVEEGKDEQN